MADPTLDNIGQWILDNKDKAGTPDFVKMSDAYRQMSNSPADVQTPDQNAPTTRIVVRPDGSNLPDISDVVRAKNTADPYNADNTINRIVTGAATGIPDTVIALGNAMQRMRGEPEAPYLGPKMLAAGGGVPLPEDAGWGRQIAEGSGSALLGGGASAVKSAIRNAPSWLGSIVPAAKTLLSSTVAPTVAANAGGQAGGAIGGETGALLGSLLGGAASNAGAAVKTSIYNRYAGQGKPDAPAIAAAAARQNIPETAGMLGNADIQHQERQLAGRPGAVNYINARRQSATDAMGAAIDRVATARGSTDLEPSQASIGQNLKDIAATSAEDLKARVSAEQQQLEDRIGFHTEVPVRDIFHAGYAQMPSLSIPGREAIDYRLTNHLAPLVTRDAAGQPILDATGSPTVKYGLLRQWRSDLGRSFEQGKYPAATAQLYEPATNAMGNAAARAGVSPQEFMDIQSRYRNAMGEPQPGVPNYRALTDIAGKEESPAYNYLHGGANNPSRLVMLEGTRHPQLPATFGDYLRMIGNQTLGKGDARGPINFADRVSAPKMDPAALDVIAGPQAPDVRDIASVARATNYPTSQTGLTRAMGGVGDSLVNKLIGSEVFGKVGEVLGVGNTAGRIVGLGAGPAFHYLQARLQQGPTARDALAGRPQAPGTVFDVNRLRAALIAANAGRQAGQ
jgi:hypothetical protein